MFKIARRTLKLVHDIFSLIVIDLIVRLTRIYLFPTPLANDFFFLFFPTHIQIPPLFSQPSIKPIPSTNMLVIDIAVPPLTVFLTPLPPFKDSFLLQRSLTHSRNVDGKAVKRESP